MSAKEPIVRKLLELIDAHIKELQEFKEQLHVAAFYESKAVGDEEYATAHKILAYLSKLVEEEPNHAYTKVQLYKRVKNATNVDNKIVKLWFKALYKVGVLTEFVHNDETLIAINPQIKEITPEELVNKFRTLKSSKKGELDMKPSEEGDNLGKVLHAKSKEYVYRPKKSRRSIKKYK